MLSKATKTIVFSSLERFRLVNGTVCKFLFETKPETAKKWPAGFFLKVEREASVKLTLVRVVPRASRIDRARCSQTRTKLIFYGVFITVLGAPLFRWCPNSGMCVLSFGICKYYGEITFKYI